MRHTAFRRYLWFCKPGAAGAWVPRMADTELLAIATRELHKARPSTVGRIEPAAIVNTPHGRIHFAGEHTAATMTGMEGATGSAVSVRRSSCRLTPSRLPKASLDYGAGQARAPSGGQTTRSAALPGRKPRMCIRLASNTGMKICAWPVDAGES